MFRLQVVKPHQNQQPDPTHSCSDRQETPPDSIPMNPPPDSANDGYMRNQGVGSWELNLAAFLADLNTNEWGQAVGSAAALQPGAGTYYLYNQPTSANSGH